MHFSVIQPSPPLQEIVERYWVAEVSVLPGQVLEIPVSAGIHLGIIFQYKVPHYIRIPSFRLAQLPICFIAGHLTHQFINIVTHESALFGIDFKHTAFYELFKMPTYHFTDAYVDIDLVFGQRGRIFREKLMEANNTAERVGIAESFLLAVLQSTHHYKDCTDYAVKLIKAQEGTISIKDLSEKLNISGRHFGRNFTEKVGVNPKLYARIMRFNYVSKFIQAHPYSNWHDVIHRFGYYDQSHLIKEFIQFSGANPSIFVHDNQDFNKYYY